MDNKPSILSIVSEYVQLRRAGKEHIGICPFHADKNPSFSVNEEKGLFFCHSCRTGGDVVRFVELVKKVSFKEALSILGMAEEPKGRRLITPRQRKAAELAATWLAEQRAKINVLLAERLEQIDLADELGDGELADVLIRDQSFLRDLYEDLDISRNAAAMLSLRPTIEAITEGVTVPEVHFEFPKLTAKYRAHLKAIVESYS